MLAGLILVRICGLCYLNKVFCCFVVNIYNLNKVRIELYIIEVFSSQKCCSKLFLSIVDYPIKWPASRQASIFILLKVGS